MILDIELSGEKHRAELTQRDGKYLLRVNDGAEEEISATFPEPTIVQLQRNGKSYEFRVETMNGELTLDRRGKKYPVTVRDPRALRSRRGGAVGEAGPQKISAPMPGKIVRIIAPEGTEVEAGAGVIVIEAMKMQNELKSPKRGRVQKVSVVEGSTVNPGDTLAIIE